MEETKATAYYEELTRKGEGAARFKQGLGFSTTSYSSSSGPLPSKSSSSSSSLFSNFVRASSPSKAEKQAQLETIQAKLRRSKRSPSPELLGGSRVRDGDVCQLSSSKERRRERDRDSRLRSRDRKRSSSSYSSEEEYRERCRRSKSRRRDRDSSPRGNRSRSPRDLNWDHSRDGGSSRRRTSAENCDTLDYNRLIHGYAQMTPAEKVKAKMKLQLSQTVAKDTTMSMNSGWERFDFNKDAPLDDDKDDIEVAEDDVSLVKEIGNSFRFSAVQAKREEQIKSAHDEAMFGVSAPALAVPESETNKRDVDDDDTKMANNEKQYNNLLLSDKVLEKQQGSWRDRVGRFRSGFDS